MSRLTDERGVACSEAVSVGERAVAVTSSRAGQGLEASWRPTGEIAVLGPSCPSRESESCMDGVMLRREGMRFRNQ